MYAVSDLYRSIVGTLDHWFEPSVVIWGTGRRFRMPQIIRMSTQLKVFPGEQPSVGACISAELSLDMIKPEQSIPRMAQVAPAVKAHDATRESEWVPQGRFFIDTRSIKQSAAGEEILSLHCYDSMLKTEQDYPSTNHAWPCTDTQVVQEIANAIGVAVDPRTWDVMTDGFSIPLPIGYSMREVLGNIGAMYAGNWIMNYDGELLLVPLTSAPAETNYLVTNSGDAITFGGVRILV